MDDEERELREQAKKFKALQKVLAAQGSFKNMQMATICAGLSEVAEMMADSVKRRESTPPGGFYNW